MKLDKAQKKYLDLAKKTTKEEVAVLLDFFVDHLDLGSMWESAHDDVRTGSSVDSVIRDLKKNPVMLLAEKLKQVDIKTWLKDLRENLEDL